MNSCEAVEHTLHPIDVREIHADIVIPTPLAVNQPKPASRVVVARAGAAQVDHRSQLLLVLECGGGHSVPLEGDRDTPVEVGRSEFNRVSRHHPGIQPIEPARSPTIPRPILRDNVMVNAIAPRFCKRSIGNLIHPDGARSRPVHLEGL